MDTVPATSTRQSELLRVVRGVRQRWRFRVALTGAVIVAGAALLVLLLSSAGMERFGFSPASVTAFRVLAYGAVLALALRFLALPLFRRVPDERVALYVEEHEPSLDAAVLSAVEAERQNAPAASDRSPALVRRLIELAAARLRAVDDGRRVERGALLRTSGALAAVVIVGVAIVALGPAFLRQGARLLLVPWREAEAATPYAIIVEPGNATIPRGGDQKVTARLRGFGSDEVEIVVRRDSTGEPERVPMSVGADSGEFVFRLFDIDERTEYFVESNGVRSPVYRIDVVALPYVQRIDLEYRFPAYTGMAPQIVENGGDIAALRGTTVIVRATPTMPVRAGHIVVEGRDAIPLVPGDSGVLSGTLKVTREGFYKVYLQGQVGDMVEASLDYSIDVLSDGAPTVSFVKPGRDSKVTSVEEVLTEVEAADDYGVRKLELVYSVNGGEERSIVLHGADKRRLKDVSAAHTFFLEEMGLEPGDFISYYARATDADQIGSKSTTSDIYFMEVRPFDQEYRQAEQRGAGGGGGGEAPGALSQRQREIIAGTFKTERDRETFSESEQRENLATLALSQGRLRERVEQLARRMIERGVAVDSTLAKVAAELPLAAEAMRAAEEQLGKRNAKDALPPEQKALQHLQRAEAAFREVQVSFGEQGGGGGGGNANAEDLADLFELETDKLRNQYETVERGQRENTDEQVDETLERLRRLAARQQQENERMRRASEALRSQAGGGSGGGDSQRRLAQEAEQMARQLERLARERSSPELAETARRLRDAANAMRRSAANSAGGGEAEGAAALQRLEDARRLLDENRNARTGRDAREALRRAEELAAEQRRIASAVEKLPEAGAGQAEQQQRVMERKEELARGVGELEGLLDRMARESRRDQREAARKMQEAANSIREKNLQEKILYSREVVQGGSPEYARNFESQIGEDLEQLRERVAEAAGTVSDSPERRLGRSLDRARDLVRGMESLAERSRNGQARDGESQEGRQGEQGQQGQRGEQGQQSQQGQQGRQGQGAGARGDDRSRQPGGAQGVSPGGSARGGQPGGYSPEEIRQYTREMRDRRAEFESLRRELQQLGQDVSDLDALVRQMRELEMQRTYGDREEIERLQGSVIEGLKAFEFALRRQLEGAGEARPLLGRTDEVPAGFRQLVEEYYRSLAKKGGAQ